MVQLKHPVFEHARGRRSEDCPERFRYDAERKVLIRTVRLSHANDQDSEIPVEIEGATRRAGQATLAAAYDYAWLRLSAPPPTLTFGDPIRCVDLFSGLGGMSLGIEEAARAVGRPFELAWTADTDEKARASIASHHHLRRRPFRHPIERILDGELGSPLTPRERALRDVIGPIDFLVGGPPCQGHSNLNNHTRRNDKKNQLYLRMVRAAEVFRPRHLIIENVPGVEKDNGRVMDLALAHLENRRHFDYRVDAQVLRAERVGVAQGRHRMFLVASRNTVVDLERIVETMSVPFRPFEWACHDLEVNEDRPFDTPACPSPATKRRIDWLFEEPGRFNLPNSLRPPCHQKPHRYTSVYGRMWQNQPASTITTGFLVMGQGRFVHPSQPRTMTPHEGARIQFLPDWVRLPSPLFRKHYGALIGNAVPPKLTYILALALIRGQRP